MLKRMMCVVVVMVLASNASASIIAISLIQSVTADDNIFLDLDIDDNSSLPPVDLSVAAGGVASASQTVNNYNGPLSFGTESATDSLDFEMTYTADATVDTFGGGAFLFTFELDTAQPYSFTFSSTTSPASLLGPDDFLTLPPPGWLQPGTYRLGGGQSAFDHEEISNFHLIIGVPEPASLGLLAVGGSIMLRRRR